MSGALAVAYVMQAVGGGLTTAGLIWGYQGLFLNGSPEVEARGLLALAWGNALQAWAMFTLNVPGMGWFFAVLAAVFFWAWWRTRPPRNRRRALRELGAKARARVEALVERLGPAPQPV